MTDKEKYITYEESGVNVNRGDECSRIAYQACQRTFANQEIDIVTPEKLSGGFAGPLKIETDLTGSSIVNNSDGVGSKALVAQRMDKHDTLGFDLVAMLADDTSATGALPVGGTNTIDIHRAEPEIVAELMNGLVSACKEANIAMVGGEIAELPDQIKGYSNPYIWNGSLVGIQDEVKRVDGSSIAAGHSIVALKSRGIRANGLTLAREICKSSYGDEWHQEPFDEDRCWGDVLLERSRICTPLIMDLLGRFRSKSNAEITGIVHVTGGGLANLPRVLPKGLGAVIEDLFPPQQEFIRLQQLGPVSDEEAYKTWNMGQCALLLTPEPEKVQRVASEHRVQSRTVGEVREEETITVKSRGREEKDFHL